MSANSASIKPTARSGRAPGEEKDMTHSNLSVEVKGRCILVASEISKNKMLLSSQWMGTRKTRKLQSPSRSSEPLLGRLPMKGLAH